MSNGFTKIYREERELLWQTNSIAAYEVYMHLKDKYSYFNDDCYDLEKCISSYLDIPQRTIKDAIKRLKTVGLVTVTKRGKVNVYGFPIVDKLEGKVKEQDMGMCLGTIEELESKTIERQPDTQDVAKTEIEPQTTDLSDTFDNYSKELNNFLDENEQRINGWVSAISNGIVCKSNITEFPKEMAIKNIEKIITEYGTITKDAIDFKEYMSERITDNIRQKRYERAIR